MRRMKIVTYISHAMVWAMLLAAKAHCSGAADVDTHESVKEYKQSVFSTKSSWNSVTKTGQRADLTDIDHTHFRRLLSDLSVSAPNESDGPDENSGEEPLSEESKLDLTYDEVKLQFYKQSPESDNTEEDMNVADLAEYRPISIGPASKPESSSKINTMLNALLADNSPYLAALGAVLMVAVVIIRRRALHREDELKPVPTFFEEGNNNNLTSTSAKQSTQDDDDSYSSYTRVASSYTRVYTIDNMGFRHCTIPSPFLFGANYGSIMVEENSPDISYYDAAMEKEDFAAQYNI
mmetsp:Transcript_5767/g.9195  ORF Transcript_5767/g.9195 Transcript_5767/m.9195 type:complete len:293 (+) Transcript_5767:62-940(+)